MKKIINVEVDTREIASNQIPKSQFKGIIVKDQEEKTVGYVVVDVNSIHQGWGFTPINTNSHGQRHWESSLENLMNEYQEYTFYYLD